MLVGCIVSSAATTSLAEDAQIAQQDAREFTEKLEKFLTFSSRIFERNELNACPKLPPGLLSD